MALTRFDYWPTVADLKMPLIKLALLFCSMPLGDLAVPPARAAAWPAAWDVRARQRAWHSVVLHHSASTAGDVASIDAAHRRRKDAEGHAWLGIGYHFVIGNGQGMRDGEVQPTFRWTQQLAGAHAGTRVQNESGIGICLIGDFNRVPPTARQLAAVKHLLSLLAERYTLRREQILRHVDVRATECPGRQFPFAEVASVVPGTRPHTGAADTSTSDSPAALPQVFRDSEITEGLSPGNDVLTARQTTSRT